MVGATYPEELAAVRRVVGDEVPLLVPGVGAQGGDAATARRVGANDRGTGLLVNNSRAVLYASAGPDFAVGGPGRRGPPRDDAAAGRTRR